MYTWRLKETISLEIHTERKSFERWLLLFNDESKFVFVVEYSICWILVVIIALVIEGDDRLSIKIIVGIILFLLEIEINAEADK